MKFDINEYKGKFVMHCKTDKEAKDFCNYLHSIGRRWCDGGSYYLHTCFIYNKENTVYYFNDGHWGDLINARANNYTILEWEDFMEKKFTKVDLKDGMVVEYRDGSRRMVMGDRLFGYNIGVSLDDFTNTLEPLDNQLSNMMTIDKVYESMAVVLKDYFDTKNLTLIWERPKEEPIKEMTVAEIEKELGYKVKIKAEN